MLQDESSHMRKMSNLEYSFMVQELQSLVGKHFNRIRRISDGIYRMKIGSTELLMQLGIRLHRTRYMEEAQPSDQLVQRLEKELDNAKLLSLEQVNEDRIVSFSFDKGKLILEMFGGGNAVLVRDGKVIAASRYERWAGRQIMPDSEYRPPAMKPSSKLEPSDRYIIVSMVKLPYGREYAIEALARAGIGEKTPGDKLSQEQIAALEAELIGMRDSAKPYLFKKDGRLLDYSLTPLSAYPGAEAVETASLSEALDEYYAKAQVPDERMEKLERRLEKQMERLGSLKEEEALNKMKGDLIYERYQEVEEMIACAKKGEFRDWKVNKKERWVEAELQ
jgi:predicted ribosome quality control (RQC) complex YloA/Tae2 family protein